MVFSFGLSHYDLSTVECRKKTVLFSETGEPQKIFAQRWFNVGTYSSKIEREEVAQIVKTSNRCKQS